MAAITATQRLGPNGNKPHSNRRVSATFECAPKNIFGLPPAPVVSGRFLLQILSGRSLDMPYSSTYPAGCLDTSQKHASARYHSKAVVMEGGGGCDWADDDVGDDEVFTARGGQGSESDVEPEPVPRAQEQSPRNGGGRDDRRGDDRRGGDRRGGGGAPQMPTRPPFTVLHDVRTRRRTSLTVQ
jgi:hypothetical protein